MRISRRCSVSDFGFCDLNSPNISRKRTGFVGMDGLSVLVYQYSKVVIPPMLANPFQCFVELILVLPLYVRNPVSNYQKGLLVGDELICDAADNRDSGDYR